MSAYPERDQTWLGQQRDNLAFHIAMFAFNRIATPWYAAMIEGSIRLGIGAAREEAKADAPAFDLKSHIESLNKEEQS